MARLPRINLPDIPQHVIQRGNNRQNCFYENNDYIVYLSKLKKYSTEFNVKIHAYVLMTNHVHLLATPKTCSGMSNMMQALGRYYVSYFNKRHKRTGTLWEGRFKASIVDSDLYFLIVSRYIELNPVRAKIVVEPSQYTWSSFHFNSKMKKIKLITPHDLYLALGATPYLRAKYYTSLFESEIPSTKMQEIRNAINGSKVLGNEEYKRKIEHQTGLTIIPKPWGGNRH
ncbi:MAG: transposase [Gammaproteobacteria bacterium]|nr:transposase [Gammaproteobacteria bacterium]